MVERAVDDADPDQHIVDDAIVLQQPDPGVDADQEGGPEGDGDQHQQHRPQARALHGDGIGDGIADEDAEHRGHRGGAQRAQIGFDDDGIGDELGEIVEADVEAEPVAGKGEERRYRAGWCRSPLPPRSSRRSGRAAGRTGRYQAISAPMTSSAAVPGEERARAGRLGWRISRPSRGSWPEQQGWRRHPSRSGRCSPRAKGYRTAGRIGLGDLHQRLPPATSI